MTDSDTEKIIDLMTDDKFLKKNEEFLKDFIDLVYENGYYDFKEINMGEVMIAMCKKAFTDDYEFANNEGKKGVWSTFKMDPSSKDTDIIELSLIKNGKPFAVSNFSISHLSENRVNGVIEAHPVYNKEENCEEVDIDGGD